MSTLKARDPLTLMVGQRPSTPAGSGIGGRATPNNTSSGSLNSTAATIRRTASKNIATPQIRKRTDVELSFKDPTGEVIESPYGPTVSTFSLPPNRILEKGYTSRNPNEHRGKTSVFYTIDKYDRQWLKFYNVSQQTSGGGSGKSGKYGGKTGGAGKAGGFGTGTSSGSLVLTPSQFEKMMTAWEIAAVNNPELSIERLKAEHIIDEEVSGFGLSMKHHLDAVRQHWIAKRNANGGVALLAEFIPNPKYDDQNKFCSELQLVDYRLPFSHRDYTDHLLRRKALDPTRPKSPRDEATGLPETDIEECRTVVKKYLNEASAILESSLERELLQLKHTQMTIYELACLRNAADGATTATSSSGSTGLDALHDSKTPLSTPFNPSVVGFEAMDVLHPVPASVEE